MRDPEARGVALVSPSYVLQISGTFRFTHLGKVRLARAEQKAKRDEWNWTRWYEGRDKRKIRNHRNYWRRKRFSVCVLKGDQGARFLDALRKGLKS